MLTHLVQVVQMVHLLAPAERSHYPPLPPPREANPGRGEPLRYSREQTLVVVVAAAAALSREVAGEDLWVGRLEVAAAT